MCLHGALPQCPSNFDNSGEKRSYCLLSHATYGGKVVSVFFSLNTLNFDANCTLIISFQLSPYQQSLSPAKGGI